MVCRGGRCGVRFVAAALLCTRAAQLAVRPGGIDRRRALGAPAVLLGGGPKIASAASLSTARALSDSEFYVTYPYRTAGDVVPFLENCATRNDPDSVLAALELWADRYPMFQLGPAKGAILDEAVRTARPRKALEIGTFLGYSAVRIARALRNNDGALCCVEASPEFADVARRVLEYAGLGGGATVVVAKGADCADAVVEAFGGGDTHDAALDLVFLDHAKEAYAPDLQRLEARHLVRPGTVVVADNVVFPGAPGYLDYVAPPRYRTRLVAAPYEARGWETNWEPHDDAVAVSVRLAEDEVGEV